MGVMVFCTALSQVTGLVCHYDPKLKSQSLKYRHPTSARKKKFRTQPSAGNCMHTVFWDCADIIQQECMIRGTKFDLQTYMKFLKMLEVQINHFCCSKANASPTRQRQTPHYCYYFSGDTEHQVGCFSMPSLQPKFGTVCHLIDCISLVSSQRNAVHMLCRSSSC